jgi:CBS-domain-containing membrane protein
MMSKSLETIQEMASVQEAAKEMKQKNVSSLVVVDNQNKPQAIVTERHVLMMYVLVKSLLRRLCLLLLLQLILTHQHQKQLIRCYNDYIYNKPIQLF